MELKASFLVVLLLASSFAQSHEDEDYREDSRDEDEPEINTELSKKGEYIADGKYTLYTDAKSWLKALVKCWAKGGDLAVPRSPEDAMLLGRLLASATVNISGADMVDAVHVGLTDSNVEGDWWTVQGSSVAATGYNNWLGGRQVSNTSANCAALLADGHYIQLSCHAVLAYACEPSPTQAERSAGYVDIAVLGTYKLHTEPLTWTEAGRRCEEEGAKLAVPTSPRAAGLLAGTLVTAAKNETIRREGFFVGINDLAAEGVWRTILDEELGSTGFETWAPDEPSGGRRENCGVLMADGRYADYPCTKRMAFCCELGGPHRKDEEAFATLGRYSIFNERLSWSDAAISCHRKNATLAAPRDKEEFDSLRQLAKEISSDGFYHMGAFHTKGKYRQSNLEGKKIFYNDINENSQHSFYNDHGYYEQRLISGHCLAFKSGSYSIYATDCFIAWPYICESPTKI